MKTARLEALAEARQHLDNLAAGDDQAQPLAIRAMIRATSSLELSHSAAFNDGFTAAIREMQIALVSGRAGMAHEADARAVLARLEIALARAMLH
ncbi:hypothetical protein N9H93_04335 [Rhizobiaceae bacterium]|nr:hypothetical protein [Rhizobiaceae bacterium]